VPSWGTTSHVPLLWFHHLLHCSPNFVRMMPGQGWMWLGLLRVEMNSRRSCRVQLPTFSSFNPSISTWPLQNWLSRNSTMTMQLDLLWWTRPMRMLARMQVGGLLCAQPVASLHRYGLPLSSSRVAWQKQLYSRSKSSFIFLWAVLSLCAILRKHKRRALY
jgi:hypothetical protein